MHKKQSTLDTNSDDGIDIDMLKLIFYSVSHNDVWNLNKILNQVEHTGGGENCVEAMLHELTYTFFC